MRAELRSDMLESFTLMYYVPKVCDRDNRIFCVTSKYERRQRQRIIPSGVRYLAKVEIVGVGLISNLTNAVVFCIIFNFA